MSLAPLFAPSSVAVLGVSRNPAKLGFRLLQNVLEHGYAGRVYPVNPSGASILGLASVRSVAELPEGVDLALVSLPAEAVPAALAALAARKAHAAVVLSSGFGEVDDAGRDAQDAVLRGVRAAGVRLVGPNCMGVYSAPVRLNGTYFWDLPRVPGGISVISQSGAYGGLIFRHLGSRGLGVARFLSIGNQADVDIAEVLDYLRDDAATTLVACFIEAVRAGRRFVDAARAVTAVKPVVVLKGGRSDAGRRAAGSHTGSLAGSYDVFRAACRQAGVVLAAETEEFFDAIETLAVAGAPRRAARQIAILTVSGGPSVVAADTAEREGLVVPALADASRRALRALLPPFAAVGNPVDLTPQVDPARIADAVRVVVEAPEIEGVVAVNVGLDIPEFSEAIVTATRAAGKPAVAFTADAPKITERFRAGGVPVLPTPERAVRAFRVLVSGAPPPRATAEALALPVDLADAIARTRGPLPYALARRALETAGVRFCRERVATSVDDAVAAADAIGYPVVLKADDPALLHKTEAGGVRLGLDGPDAVRAAFRDVTARTRATRVVIQQQVGPGVELLIGARRDESFGAVVAVGIGGVLTEVLRDVSFRLAPVGREDAEEMLREGARPRLLAGPRGLPAVDAGTVVTAIQAVSRLVAAESRIVEIDVNPLVAAGREVVAVDAVVVVDDGPPGTEVP
ncbi:MAG: acetate--CoA ligase family protein [Candidatus Rokubacteria bacterium]|nr:acetate--CoA ligase family protein [Candidatus Rokubacteria bacterium]